MRASPHKYHQCSNRYFIIAAIAQLVARRSHNPKVVSSILTVRILFIAVVSSIAKLDAWHVCCSFISKTLARRISIDKRLKKQCTYSAHTVHIQ